MILMRSFIHHSGALGDVLLSLPCIRAIKETSDFVHIACRPDIGSLLQCCGCADETSSPDSSLYSSLYTAETNTKVGEFLRSFDRAFIFTAAKNSPFALAVGNNVPETKSIITIPPDGVREHAAVFRLRQLVSVSVSRMVSPLLDIPPAYRSSARALLVKKGCSFDEARLIILHPGSGGKRKCWPLEHYLALAGRMVCRRESFVVMLSGPVEDSVTRNKIDAFAEAHDNALHVRNEELVVVAALLNSCSLYIGNDSGISHLAGAVNRNVIALFGPTDPHVWKPLGDRVRVISSNALSEISVEEVHEVAEDSLILI